MLSAAPRLAAEVAIDPAADAFRIVHNRTSERYFRLGEREADFLEALDGTRPLAMLRSANAEGFSAEQVDHLLAWFAGHGLLEGAPAPAGESVKRGRIARLFAGPDRWRVKLGSPDRFLDRHRASVDRLFGRQAMGIYLLAAILPAFLFIAWPQLGLTAFAAYRAELPATHWLLLYLMMVATVVLHELAHAAACKHFGGRVGQIGLMFLYLHPVPYCDVSDSWRFREKRHRIAVAAAGIFLQLVLSAVALTAWMASGEPVFGHYAIINAAIALFNFFPLVKLDGYWMLVHLLGEPNLKQKGLAALNALVRQRLGRPIAADWRARPGLLVFGAAHALVVPLFWVLGLYAMFRLGSRVSPALGYVLLAGAGLFVAYRAARSSLGYLKSLGAQ